MATDTSLSHLTLAIINLATNVITLPPGAPTNIRPPCWFFTQSSTARCTWLRSLSSCARPSWTISFCWVQASMPYWQDVYKSHQVRPDPISEEFCYQYEKWYHRYKSEPYWRWHLKTISIPGYWLRSWRKSSLNDFLCTSLSQHFGKQMSLFTLAIPAQMLPIK